MLDPATEPMPAHPLRIALLIIKTQETTQGPIVNYMRIARLRLEVLNTVSSHSLALKIYCLKFKLSAPFLFYARD